MNSKGRSTNDIKQLISSRSRLNAGHVAWIAMFCSIFLWTTGEVQAGTLGNTGNWYRISLVLFAAFTVAFVSLRNAHRIARALPGPLLLLLSYGVIAMVSALYIPAHSFYSMWKGLEIVIDVMAVAAILSFEDPLDSARMAYKIILAIFGALLIVYWIEAAIIPSQVFLPSRGLIPFTMDGVLPIYNANALGFLSAVVAFAGICSLLRQGRLSSKVFACFFTGLALLTLVFAQARTSTVGFGVALCVFLFFARRYGLFAVMVAASVISYAITGDIAKEYLLRGQSDELVTSLSGRTYAWTAAWEMFQQSPILGHGFAAFARVAILGPTGSTLHGALFDVLVGVGLLGLIPWCFSIVWTASTLVRLSFNRHPWFRTLDGRNIQAEMLGILALIFVRTSTSSGLSQHEHTFMLFLAVLAYTYSMRRAAKSIPRKSSEPSLAITIARA